MSALLTHIVEYLALNNNALKTALGEDNEPNENQKGFLSRMFSKNKGNNDLPLSKDLKKILESQARELADKLDHIPPLINKENIAEINTIFAAVIKAIISNLEEEKEWQTLLSKMTKSNQEILKNGLYKSLVLILSSNLVAQKKLSAELIDYVNILANHQSMPIEGLVTKLSSRPKLLTATLIGSSQTSQTSNSCIINAVNGGGDNGPMRLGDHVFAERDISIPDALGKKIGALFDCAKGSIPDGAVVAAIKKHIQLGMEEKTITSVEKGDERIKFLLNKFTTEFKQSVATQITAEDRSKHQTASDLAVSPLTQKLEAIIKEVPASFNRFLETYQKVAKLESNTIYQSDVLRRIDATQKANPGTAAAEANSFSINLKKYKLAMAEQFMKEASHSVEYQKWNEALENSLLLLRSFEAQAVDPQRLARLMTIQKEIATVMKNTKNNPVNDTNQLKDILRVAYLETYQQEKSRFLGTLHVKNSTFLKNLESTLQRLDVTLPKSVQAPSTFGRLFTQAKAKLSAKKLSVSSTPMNRPK